MGGVTLADNGPDNDFLADRNVLFVRLKYRIDGALLDRAPALKVIVSPTTGHNHIDCDALQARGIALLSLKGETEFLESIRATPEHTFGLLLALVRNYRHAFRDTCNREWNRDAYRGEEIAGMKVAMVGYGRVGRRVTEYLRAFGAQVRWIDPAPKLGTCDPGRADDLLGLITWSRAVILAASHDPASSLLFDRRAIAALSGRYLINTARGELIDEDALLEAIEFERLAGVAVDVICSETGENQLARWLTLADRRNVIVTPHIGGATWTSMQATEEFMTAKLIAFLEGKSVGPTEGNANG